MHRLAAALEEASRTRSKKAKVARLAGALRAVADDAASHLGFAARLLEGRVGAPFERRSLGAGRVLVLEAAARALGLAREELGARASRLGDLGDAVGEAAEELASRHAPAGLSLGGAVELVVHLERAKTRGEKEAALEAALRAARAVEARFLVKALLCEARTGAALGLVLEAIGVAFDVPAREVRRAYGAMPDVGEVALHAAAGTVGALRAELGRPIGFMLASPHEDPDGEAWYVEDKLDGVRAQLHAGGPGSFVRLFARGGDDVAESFPELCAAATSLPPCVLDGEIVAVHPDGRPRPFGALQARLNRRGTPLDGDTAYGPGVLVRFFAFDALVLHGEPLLGRTLEERKAALAGLALEPPLSCLDSTLVAPLDDAAVERAYAAARGRGHEGVVVKRPDSTYDPGRRGGAWCKVKRALATLDVVVTAAERGHGKRAGWLSDVTFAVWRAAPDVLFESAEPRELVDLGKSFTGLTDAELRDLTERLRSLAVGSRGHVLLVRPEIVLEVAFDGLSRSTRHGAGFALRFPRIVRERTDKRPEEASTLREVLQLFEREVRGGHREEPTAPATAGPARARRRRRDAAPGQLSLFADAPRRGDE